MPECPEGFILDEKNSDCVPENPTIQASWKWLSDSLNKEGLSLASDHLKLLNNLFNNR